VAAWAHDWVLQPQLLPAWLSGVAAVVALGIGVWSVARTGAVERRRDLLQSRNIGVAIYPALLRLPLEIQNARKDLTAVRAAQNFPGQSVAASIQGAARIGLPSAIERNIDSLFMLGDLPGAACQQLVTVIEQHNDMVDAIAQRMMVMGPGQWAEGVDHLQNSLTLLDQVVAKCESEVKVIHDAVKG